MKIFFTSIALLVTLFANCQNFVINKDSVLFPSTNELQSSNVGVYIHNQSNSSVDIDTIYFPEVYQHSPFKANFSSGKTIVANDSLFVMFEFAPQQNILFKQDPLVVFTNGESININFHAQGEFSNTYYNSIQNKSEEDLKTALKARLSNPFYSLSYNTARDNMYGTIDNVGGDVECVYTGRMATFNTRAGANSNNFNCEHTFPQSKFNSNQPMQGDIHHLFPVDASSNSVRSNNPFGNIQGNPSWSVGGSKLLSGTFEPRNEHKGDAARAMMYFVVRHQDYTNFFAPQEQTLRQWHLENLPTQKSINRNNAIENVQKNRNPFVDYPQLIHRITKLSGTSNAFPVYNLVADVSPIYFEEVDQITEKAILQKAISNFGNTAITISNFQFTNGNHQILNLPATSTLVLNPSESFVLEIEIDPLSQTLNSTQLTFETTDLNTQNATIDISWDQKLAIYEMNSEPNFQIFPNPNQGNFVLNLNSEIENIQVLNYLSQNIEFDLVRIDNLTYNINIYQPKGTYFIKVNSQNNSFTQKVIVW